MCDDVLCVFFNPFFHYDVVCIVRVLCWCGWVWFIHMLGGVVVGVCDRGECDVHEGCGCCGIRVGGRGVEVVGMVVGVS